MQAISGKLIVKTLHALANGTAVAIPQPDAKKMMLAPKLSKSEHANKLEQSGAIHCE